MFQQRQIPPNKEHFHLVDNEDSSTSKGKDHKVSALYSYLNEKFKQFGIIDEYLAVDEQIVKYFGHISLKQFIRNKPIRFGIKNWEIAGKSGYCYHVKLYCGKEDGQVSRGQVLFLTLSQK